MKKFMVFGVVALLGLVVAAAALGASGPASPVGSPRSAYSGGGFSHAQLESDRMMTQEMSVGDHAAHDCATAMRERSSAQGYVRALEQHAADLNRMMARMP